MLVRCEKDGSTFETVPEPYPLPNHQSKHYDVNGDRRIVCSTCGRAYFFYNGVDTAEKISAQAQGKWYSDRPLTILKP
jgi:hypothetical protein